MMKARLTLKALALAVFMLAFSALAHAQTRTWVSGVGDDLNPCSRTAPCKTFAGAISKTADKGEIDALDPGGFGTVTITKNITLEGQGTLASILNAGTNGVNVNDSATATPNTIIVHLRNISIQGAGTGFDGIKFTSGKRLFVENCVIAGQKGNGVNSDGIDFSPTAAAQTFGLTVTGTVIKDSTGDGVRVFTSSSTINGSVDESHLSGNANGLEVLGGTINVTRCQVDNNTGSGLSVSNGAFLNADDNKVTDNGTGLNNNSSNFRISNNGVHRNTTGLGGVGTFQSFGNNAVIGNTTEVSGSITISNVSATNFK